MNEEIARLRSRIDSDYARIEEIQAVCAHRDATKTHGANTGNYDPHADTYWTDYDCPDCGKRWTVFHDR